LHVLVLGLVELKNGVAPTFVKSFQNIEVCLKLLRTYNTLGITFFHH
jgi:hypothetical protein